MQIDIQLATRRRMVSSIAIGLMPPLFLEREMSCAGKNWFDESWQLTSEYDVGKICECAHMLFLTSLAAEEMAFLRCCGCKPEGPPALLVAKDRMDLRISSCLTCSCNVLLVGGARLLLAAEIGNNESSLAASMTLF